MRFFFLFLLPVFIFSCSGNEESGKLNDADPFREDVLRLHRAGLLKNFSDAQLDSLTVVYKKDSANGIKNLLASSGDLLTIHVTLDGRKLEDVYQKICDTIGRKYPQLKCDEVQTSFVPYDPGGNDTAWVLVKVRFGTNWYERQMYYFPNWEVDEFIYRIFNRKLADDGKPERLHLVEYACPSCVRKENEHMGDLDVTKYGYLLLSKSQEDSLQLISGLRMEPENEFSIFTTAQMENDFKKFENSGLVEEVGTEWYEKAKNNIRQNSIYTTENYYEFFDTLFCTVQLDTTNDVNPYQEILVYLSGISRGKFAPQNMADDIETDTSHVVSFYCEGDPYQFRARRKGALLYPQIIDNVNEALKEHKAGGAFYSVLTVESRCVVVYIDDDKVEKAKACGFFTEFTKGASQSLKDRFASIPNDVK